MPHPKRLLLKFLLLTLVVTATILLIKPSSKLPVKAAGCPTQNSSTSQIKISSGFLSLANSSSQTGYYAPASDSNSNCLITLDTHAGIESAFLSYNALFNTYYNDLSSSTVTKTEVTDSSQVNLNLNKTVLYNSTDSAPSTITLGAISGPPIVVNGVYVVFIKGNLYIKSDITSTDTNGVVFVVSGAINIDPNVTRVDAFIVNYGAFCDNWDALGNSCVNQSPSGVPITFNGSILSINDSVTGSNASLNFTRVSPSPDTTPAETIYYQPKYFTLFKDIFSKDVTIWTEIK